MRAAELYVGVRNLAVLYAFAAWATVRHYLRGGAQ